MLRILAVLCAIALAPLSAQAQSTTPCEAMLGDFWGEKEPLAQVRTVDGTRIGSPQDLARAVREGAIVQGGTFAGWTFSRIALSNACFVEADLSRTDWTDARAAGIGFIRSNLTDAVMTGIRAPGVLFRDANLANVRADKADFSNGQLEGGWFEGSVDGWVLDGADLSGFQFSCGITLSDGCPLYGSDRRISARGANLTRARLSSFHRYGLTDIDLDGARLDRTEISPAQLASLKGRMISHPLVLVGGDMTLALSAAEAQALVDDAAIAASTAGGPSFDCAKAASPAERLVCQPDQTELADADRALARLFGEARKTRPALIAEQRQWLKRRDGCMSGEYPSDCLRSAYAERRGQLIGLLGERDWLARGEAALFIDDELPLSEAMRASPLFARIAPLLVQASMGHAYVERRADGLYAASGESVGANAHLCSLAAEGMRLDPATGWYGVSEGEAKRPIRIIQIDGDWLRVFADGHPYGEEAEGSSDYASCGARAAFGPMRRIALPADVLKRYAERAEMER